MKRPLLPSHYAVWFDPPDEAGDEVLHVVSERLTLKLKGFAFREFSERVVPLLDGSRSLQEVKDATADVFRPQDVADMLDLLAVHGVVVEAPEHALAPDTAARLRPQLNLFHDLAPGLDLQGRLTASTVLVLGLGGAGPTAALALAAAGVGTVRVWDRLPVAPADVYLAPFLGMDAVGTGRAERVAALVRAAAPEVEVVPSATPLESEEDVLALVEGADAVVSCLDAGQANLLFKLNRVCLASGPPFIACALAGAEVVVGPTVQPGGGPCYLCYRMRFVACAGDPEDAFAYERFLDRRRQDDSGRRENLVVGAGLAGHVVTTEVIKQLTGLSEPSLVGRILTLGLTDLAVERHTILRKPGCPACTSPAAAPTGNGHGG